MDSRRLLKSCNSVEGSRSRSNSEVFQQPLKTRSLRKAIIAGEKAAALLIVLAMVVLLTGLAVAYLSRTTSDRQVAHASFHQSRVDVLAQSAMDLIIGDLRQEIANGSSPTPTPYADGSTVYMPTSAANMVPQRRANAAVAPNLIRRSVRLDTPVSPGVGSRASAVNSTTDASANGRSITLARWNTHYLLPKYNTLNNDSYPPSPLLPPFNPYPAVPNGFTPPDWVFVAPDPNNPTQDARKIIPSPDPLVIGRYAYAIYDEGGLLDMNVAGYPTDLSAAPIPAQRLGRKGSIAFADLTALGSYPFFNPTSGGQAVYQIDRLVGWRNYATTNQSATTNNNFPDSQPTNRAFARNFQSAGPAGTYYTYVVNNTNGFLAPTPTIAPNGLTDQVFLGRKQLIAHEQIQNTNNGTPISGSSQFDVNALQYLSAFSRETNAPSFSPASPTAVNPNFLLERVTGSFTRFDGTTAVVGEPLVKTRFPLSRLAWITYKGPSASLATTDPVYLALISAGVSPTTIAAGKAANIKACFGLVWDSRTPQPLPSNASPIGQQWVYDSPSSANTGGSFDPNSNPSGNPASDIKTLDVVASENREPDFFELLRATILDGSLGQNTGGGVSRSTSEINNNIPVFPDMHMSNKALHMLTIGACIIDQVDPDSIPTRIMFRPPQPPGSGIWWAAYGVESLPYITQIYPITGISPAIPNSPNWATYLLFQLWNPHVGPTPSPTPPQVRIRVDGGIGIFTGGNGQTWWAGATDKQAMAATGQNIALTQGAFPPTGTPTPAPLGTPGVVSVPAVGSATLPCGFERLPGSGANSLTNYVGLRLLPDFHLATGSPNNPQLTLCFGRDASNNSAPFNATMEYLVPGTTNTWVPYNHVIGINDPASWINGDTVPVHNAASAAGTPDPGNNSLDQFKSNNPNRLADAPLPDSLMKSDPRSTRFGIFQFRQPSTWTTTRITDPLWPTNNATVPNGYGGAIADPPDNTHPVEHAPCRFAGCPPATPTPTPTPTPQPYFPATFAINGPPDARDTTTTTYADNDGVIRPADAIYPGAATTSGSSTPYTTSTSYHPIILNRPFRNVAELGYAFRDLPWKTLDFFSDKSADAGLLDIFTINDGAQVQDGSGNVVGMAPPTIAAGSINLNSAQAADLQSVLAGTILDEINSTAANKTGTGDTDAPVLANRIVTAMSTTPMQNKSELITRASLPTTILPTASNDNQAVKARREVVARAVSSVAQTRVWNVVIDVVAQSGHFKPNAINLQSDFVVEGEQHYWVHVAIDRFTGQVIDKQIEVVTE
jgi:hypothetical protein